MLRDLVLQRVDKLGKKCCFKRLIVEADANRAETLAAVIDRELGWQSLGLSPPLPVVEDPSLWLELAVGE